MQTHLITIGNSKGLRFSRTLLEQCGIIDDVELDVKNNEIIIRASSRKPREGWEKMFKDAYSKGKPEMLIPESIDLDWNELAE
ncbi:AbrB/MazE/SpoVT family DNA-binding domain-containing protein [Candidatus Magnetaquicoccus inordinatus]|uniref:AbrB/MazE/SpoVT family DNA-binding domain-containing protein n=1 Tax=Candidatus Magnetaquicoccus inordinatus TaxID=2496818 RepID=UPI00102D112C|nr:AbrB/MazE/SpoVT family DNA-binding domain-containing protein [Candidatus Magnetaquicoccus inordinatus]